MSIEVKYVPGNASQVVTARFLSAPEAGGLVDPDEWFGCENAAELAMIKRYPALGLQAASQLRYDGYGIFLDCEDVEIGLAMGPDAGSVVIWATPLSDAGKLLSYALDLRIMAECFGRITGRIVA